VSGSGSALGWQWHQVVHWWVGETSLCHWMWSFGSMLILAVGSVRTHLATGGWMHHSPSLAVAALALPSLLLVLVVAFSLSHCCCFVALLCSNVIIPVNLISNNNE